MLKSKYRKRHKLFGLIGKNGKRTPLVAVRAETYGNGQLIWLKEAKGFTAGRPTLK